MKTLQEEIKQTRPFPTLEAEATVGLMRTAGVMENDFADLVKPFGITPTLYNVLRILRGAGAAGLCRYEVRDRLIAPEPDVTRLLDRLEKSGYISRERDADNRRLVKAAITKSGLELLEKLEKPLADFHAQQLGHLAKRDLEMLISLLAKVRIRD